MRYYNTSTPTYRSWGPAPHATLDGGGMIGGDGSVRRGVDDDDERDDDEG